MSQFNVRFPGANGTGVYGIASDLRNKKAEEIRQDLQDLQDEEKKHLSTSSSLVFLILIILLISV
jgi:hypothetical protein